MEIANGLGLLGGFSFSSAMYAIGGYTLPFYVNAGILIISTFCIIKQIPAA